MDIAFVGLGQMGRHMAANLLKSGARVTVTSASGKRHAELETKGARATTRAEEVAKADIVFLSLPGTAEVRDVLLGANGIARLMKKPQIVVDTSTIDYSATLEIAEALERRGVRFLDAPVSGMEARAIDGTLTAMCGGAPETLEVVRPYFSCMANSILHMGKVGNGQLAKLVNQLLFDINCAAIAEILPMAV